MQKKQVETLEETIPTQKLEGVGEEVLDISTPEREVELKQQAEEIVSQKTPEQLFQEWFGEPGNQKLLANLAEELDKHFGGDWFEMKQVITTTRFRKIEDALQVLNLLKLGNLLVAKMFKKTEKYKISINKHSRLLLLKEVEKELVKQLEETKKEIESVCLLIEEQKGGDGAK